MAQRILKIFLIAFALGACQLEDPQAGITTEEVLVLQVQDSVLLADGRDLTTLTAQLGPSADANLVVSFRTNQGYFERSEGGTPQQVDILASGREASVVLIAGNDVQERVLVDAQISGVQDSETFSFRAERILSFARAYPESLALSLADQEIPASPGSSTSLELELLRELGTVSTGTQVFFAADPLETNGPKLEIPTSAIADLSSLTVSVINSDTIPGLVLLKAWTLDLAGDTTAQASVNLEVSSD